MSRASLRLILASVALLPLMGVGHAEQVWTADDIRSLAREWMEASGKPLSPNAVVGPLDERTRLAACETTPTVAPRSARSSNHVIRCPGPKGWEITLRITDEDRPTAMSVPVLVSNGPKSRAPVDGWQVVVPRVNLSAGTILTQDYLEIRSVDASPGATALKTMSDAVGLRLIASVGPGSVLTTRNVAKAPTVLKGENVILVSNGSGFEVSAPGRAEADGYEGDLIPVKNVNSGVSVVGKLGPGGVITVR